MLLTVASISVVTARFEHGPSVSRCVALDEHNGYNVRLANTAYFVIILIMIWLFKLLRKHNAAKDTMLLVFCFCFAFICVSPTCSPIGTVLG